MTLTFRALAKLELDCERQPSFADLPEGLFYTAVSPELQKRWTDWCQHYQQVVRQAGVSDSERRVRMNAVNPALIPRNYLVYRVIEALEAGDNQPLSRLMAALQNPYDENPDAADLRAPRPDWARQVAGCSALSCSS